jgi:AAA+ ATPase superfamily predicted ATPase
MKENLFVGRKQELQELNLLLNKKSASMVVLRGRRRIGKSQLAKQFAKGHRFLSFSGLAATKKTTAQSQREELSRQMAEQLNLPEIKASDWGDLFSFLAREAKVGRVIILLDEISWMGSKDPLFLGKLKNAWDLQFKENPELILILCGSASKWIEKNILSSTGFMGRLSLKLVLEELPLDDCQQMLKALGSKANKYEQFKILSVTGGIPRYLEEIQPNLSADENIKRLCFNSSGILFSEFEDIFNDLFFKKSHIYKKIVEILVEGSLEFAEIVDRLKVKKSGFWSDYLEELVKAGFIKRDYTWNLVTGKASRLSRFRLSDNYVRFYLKYIESNKDKIESHLFDTKTISSLSGWDSIISLQFENLVLNNCRFIWKKLNLNPNDIVSHGAYFQHKTARYVGYQIDYLIKTKFNTLIACEVKFSRHKIGSEVIEQMQKKAQAIALPTGYSFWPVLVHVNGVSQALIDAEHFTHIIDFSEFLADCL